MGEAAGKDNTVTTMTNKKEHVLTRTHTETHMHSDLFTALTPMILGEPTIAA